MFSSSACASCGCRATGWLDVTLHIALLRSVNLAGRNKITMSDLKDMLSDIGFSQVRSLLQSGNLVFESRGKSGDELERLLERTTEERLKIQHRIFRPHRQGVERHRRRQIRSLQKPGTIRAISSSRS